MSLGLVRAISGGEQSAPGFVLAGGRSSRMGTDKALVELGGEPLLARALRMLEQAGLSAAIAGSRSPDLSRFAPLIDDAGEGPLGGICAALESTEAEYAVFVSVDMPLLPWPLVNSLLESARLTESVAVVASVNGVAQTFPAVVAGAALPAARIEQDLGRGGCLRSFQAASEQLERPFSKLPIEYLAQAGHVEHPDGLPPAAWFLNVNARAELARAESWLAVVHRVS